MGPAASEIAFAEYSYNWGSTPSQDSIRRTAVDIETDYIFLVPVQTAIYLHAANARWVGPTARFFSLQVFYVF